MQIKRLSTSLLPSSVDCLQYQYPMPIPPFCNMISCIHHRCILHLEATHVRWRMVSTRELQHDSATLYLCKNERVQFQGKTYLMIHRTQRSPYLEPPYGPLLGIQRRIRFRTIGYDPSHSGKWERQSILIELSICPADIRSMTSRPASTLLRGIQSQLILVPYLYRHRSK